MVVEVMEVELVVEGVEVVVVTGREERQSEWKS